MERDIEPQGRQAEARRQPRPTGLSWRLARLAVLDEMMRRAFTLTQDLVLYFVLEQSLGRGRTKAWVPSLRCFSSFISGAGRSLSRGSVCDRLRELKAARVLCESPEFAYFVNPVFGEWLIPYRLSPGAAAAQLSLLPDPPELREALLETFVESFEFDFRAGPAAVRPGGDERSADLASLGPESGSGAPAAAPRGLSLSAAVAREIECAAADAQDRPAVPFSVTPPVTEKGTLHKKERVERSHLYNSTGTGNGTETVKTVTTDQYGGRTLGGVTEKGTGAPEHCSVVTGLQAKAEGRGPRAEAMRTTKAEAERILGLVEAFLGPEAGDMAETARGPFWRAVAGRYPHELEESAKWGQYLVDTSQLEVRNSRGAWLNNMTAKAAGLKSLAGVRLGPWRIDQTTQ